MRRNKNLDTLNQALDKAAWQWDDIPAGIIIDKLSELKEDWKKNREEVKSRLTQQLEEIKKHLKYTEAAEKKGEDIKSSKEKKRRVQLRER